MQTAINSPRFLMLAPMEGVVDACLRELLSAIGGLDRCVTEFVRISGQQLPERVFLRYCPELRQHSHTASGIPVYLQLLGDRPDIMAINALRAATLGAIGIDLNFGCPARSVNNHGGGSVLLKNPENLYNIASAIRQSLPEHIPLTAKMRLGYNDKSLALDNALALQAAGVAEIAVHGRTKLEGYRPPAYWQEIGKLSDALDIPVIANGEIWNLDDLQRCIQESRTDRIMLGRGLIACPDLALIARGRQQTALHWGDICLLLLHYYRQLQLCCDAHHINNLIKQWLVYLRQHYAEGFLFFEQVKRLKAASDMADALRHELRQQQQLRGISGRIGELDLRTLLAEENRLCSSAPTVAASC